MKTLVNDQLPQGYYWYWNDELNRFQICKVLNSDNATEAAHSVNEIDTALIPA